MGRSIKNYINYILGISLFVVTVCIVASSYILWFVLPRGTGVHGSPFCKFSVFLHDELCMLPGIRFFFTIDISLQH